MIQIQTTSSNQEWMFYLRPRVGNSVSYLGSIWVNKNGKNSEPGIGLDWELVFRSINETNNPIRSNFILVHKSTNNDNNDIEVGDYARGFGPGSGPDLEYWSLAEYLNTSGNNDTNDYFNYRPINRTLPNS